CGLAVLAAAGLALAAETPGAVALLVAGGVFALWRHACRKRLGGMTGDTCGALAELVEVAVLVALALWS
ncbi:MAG: adenosylcobinamide-GDP ribazoletransferase, partial [Pseudomonas sp.]